MRRIILLRNSTYLLFALFSLAMGSSIVIAADRLNIGSGSFVFRDSRGNRDKPITVWFHRPEDLRADSPVVFVMHGVKRNGRKYRDAWIEHAKRQRFLLLVPEFSKEHYPGGRMYNRGNMFSSSRKAIDETKWTYTAIEHMFDRVKRFTKMQTPKYFIYGHSAGAQFVHRLVLFKPDARIGTAICANAGWYTFPSFNWGYPYGLSRSGMTKEKLKRAFRKQLIILLGDKDTDEDHKYLRKTPKAMAQGKHRFERGQTFYETAKLESARLGVALKWKMEVVRGVGHSNKGMAKEAVKHLPSQGTKREVLHLNGIYLPSVQSGGLDP